MNVTHHTSTRWNARLGQTVRTWAVALAAGALLAASAPAEEFHPAATPGGIQVRPVISSWSVSGSNATVNFTGLEAPYLIQVTSNNIDWDTAGRTSVQYPDFSGSAQAANVPATIASFRMLMLGSTNSNWIGKWNPGAMATNSVFVGAGKCVGCHNDKLGDWSGTHHASALSAVMDNTGAFLPGASNSCVVCHSVGNGQPGGFTSLAATPNLANVGCETCHGSASAHVNVSGRLYHPVKSLASETCGGCHNAVADANHPPLYSDWLKSPHAEPVPDVVYGISSGTVYPGTVTAVLTNNLTNIFSVVLNGYVVGTNGVTNALSGIVNSTNDISGLNRQMQCGFCHSGATRLAMLGDYTSRLNGVTNLLDLPDKWEAAETAQTCAVCHDPHSADNRTQLRNPPRSTNYYTMYTGSRPPVTNYYTDKFGQTTSTVSYLNDGFASQYNPNVQVCAQCHNSRGARWDGLSYAWTTTNATYVTNGSVITYANPQAGWVFGKSWAPTNTVVIGTTTNQIFGLTNATPSFGRVPHHSPQYNMYSGIIQDDYLNKKVNMTSPHFSTSSTTGNTNQCITCHVPRYTDSTGSRNSGHTFALDVNGCGKVGGCHGTYSLDGLHAKVEERQKNVTNSIVRVVSLLNQWALANGTNTFGGANANKYKQNGWEFTAPGVLAGATNAGPSTSDQVKIPANILQARFDLYMVLNDGSMGVHNVTYSDYLIKAAESNLVSYFPLANFRAASTAVYANIPVAFTNLGPGGTTYSWNFGDGVGTSSSANPSYTYTTRGTFTVTCTANGTQTMMRTNYIQVCTMPAVSFTADKTTVAVGTPVTFTNTSTSTIDTGLWRWQFNTADNNSRLDGGFTPTATYSYPSVGTFSVTLRATTPAGNITATNVAYINVTP